MISTSMDAGRQRRLFACSGSRAVEEKSDRFPAAGSRSRLQASLAKRSYWPLSNYSTHGPITSIFRDRRDLSLNRSSDMSLLVYLRVGSDPDSHSTAVSPFVTLDPRLCTETRQARAGKFTNTTITPSAWRHSLALLLSHWSHLCT
jgi:hypothetical protein